MDVVVTVPKGMWDEWLQEGDLPGEDAQYYSHFWIKGGLPAITPGERVYIVAHGKLRGYAPLVGIERSCQLRPEVSCLLREGGAQAVTIEAPGVLTPMFIRGFQGFRYRWWPQSAEVPFPEWMVP